MISLSLRPTTHPGTFQRSWVRTSIYLSIDFALVMGRSLSFGSILTNYSPYSDSVSLRLLPLRGLSSLIRITRRFIMQKARRHPFLACARHRAPTACKSMNSGSISLPSPGFFSTFPHGTCALSVQLEYLALPCGQGGFLRNFACSVVLGILSQEGFYVSLTGLSPSLADCSKSFCYIETL